MPGVGPLPEERLPRLLSGVQGSCPRHTRVVSQPTTVSGVITRLREIDAALPAGDGVAIFNRMYLQVTERIEAILADPADAATVFGDPETMAALDMAFAGLWLAAYDADAGGGPVGPAWRPLFEARGAGRLPVQYAVAGMNTHIEHDLPIAVVDTCLARGRHPADVHGDYEQVNVVLAEVEAPIRRSFLDAVGRQVDDGVGSIVHVLSAWDIDKARELAWVTVEAIWELRGTSPLRDHFLASLGDTVGMTTRVLLAPA